MALAALSKYQGIIDPKLWVFMVVFTQMQLVEYFLWKNLSVPSLNAMWSAIGLALILAEPAASLNMLRDKRFLALYTAGAIAYLLMGRFDFRTTIGANGHLKWNWLFSSWSFEIILWTTALLAPLYLTGHQGAALFGLVTFMISMYFNSKYGTAGSYWCWLALGAWLIVLIR
jgi:hypothetical protein